MDKLPYELLFSIAIHLDSPKDLCSFSETSSAFSLVARDDRIWNRLCYKLYNIKPRQNEMTQSFYDFFTKILVPYGKYLGYWKASTRYYGGLIYVHLDVPNAIIIGEKIDTTNDAVAAFQHFFADANNDEHADEDSYFKPVHKRTELFTIDSKSNKIFCHECKTSHEDLPWTQTFDLHQRYFGLSQEALPVNERSSLVTHDHTFKNHPEESDVYFMKHCSDSLSTIYHPLSIPQPTTSDNDHPLSRLNGIWVGTYGGHGLELLHVEFYHEFTCPATIDGRSKEVQTVPNVLVARKITGDVNVPHGKISFAAVYPITVESNSPVCYEGIGQIADTDYVDAQFIRTKIEPLSSNVIQVTWYALFHTSFFRRCLF